MRFALSYFQSVFLFYFSQFRPNPGFRFKIPLVRGRGCIIVHSATKVKEL
jgi:hypothetical protein